MPTASSLRKCFREPIPEFDAAITLLDQAATAHFSGKHPLAAKLISAADMPILREWTESLWGRHSPYLHYRECLNATPALPRKDRLRLRMPNATEKRALIARDGLHCRFCGLPVIRPEVRNELKRHYPKELRWGGTNATQHAGFQAMWLQYDHIVPHARGGTNDPLNMVITCAPCNYGRMDYLLEEVGLTDPFLWDPVKSAWDGLERVMR